jgi:hypothetical protein
MRHRYCSHAVGITPPGGAALLVLKDAMQI